ncbi:MAG: CoA transferase [Chloroflexi bacterium]|jgi:benzylsuccinate CoA-transferase BbsF subunit|nr:CoA transferase [Chloroflexota bacterium]
MVKYPLEGIRVVDFAWAWAGSQATSILALLGAEVIKIESRKRIDHSRVFSLTTGQWFDEPDHSSIFNDMNLGKLSANIDLSQPEGVNLVKRLVKISDVVAQNMRPGKIDALGLGYEVLREVKPDIIMLSSSARGNTGPEREYIGYAPLFSAISGFAYISGYEGEDPIRLSGEIDLLSATSSAFAILAALIHRQSTGEGQFIDLSSTESTSVFMGEVFMDYCMNGRNQTRRGNKDLFMAPHNVYRCQGDDKWISIAVATDEEFRALCAVAGHPEWAQNERFADSFTRWHNQAELDQLIERWTINFTHTEVMKMLQAEGVAATPSCNSEDLWNDPHLQARGFWAEVDHAVLGKKKVIAPVWKFSETPLEVKRPAPLFGEHNEYVFGELLGLDESEIERLIRDQVIH